MSSFHTMVHYYWKEGDEIVVQNWVGGMKGQEHRHSPEDFKRWSKDIKAENLIDLDEEKS
uniref:Uncharacterized protein n=1 Tax=viral metagenome TaxID=1070528 RepID=A0A6M3MAC1_9ZZZZ